MRDARQRLAALVHRQALKLSRAVLAALTVAAIQVFDGWAHLIVIGDLVIFTAAIAVWLNRD